MTYVCPMHPDVVSDVEGACPKCGMDLVERKPETEKAAPKKKEHYGKLFILLGMVLFIALAVCDRDVATESDLMCFMRSFMGVFFVVFGTFKLLGYKDFVEMFPTYDLIAMRSKLYARAYPFIEIGLGGMFLAGAALRTASVITLVLMSIGAVSIWVANKRQHGIRCACLGAVIDLPLSTISFLEDALMAVMAAMLLIG